MALPGGTQQDPPTTILKRIRQWAGFSVLVIRFFLAGLGAWLVHRWTRAT